MTLRNTTKTWADVRSLMWQWAADPTWDLEDTEGFEAYRQELLKFRREKETFWNEERAMEARIAERNLLTAMGSPANSFSKYEAVAVEVFSTLVRRMQGEDAQRMYARASWKAAEVFWEEQP